MNNPINQNPQCSCIVCDLLAEIARLEKDLATRQLNTFGLVNEIQSLKKELNKYSQLNLELVNSMKEIYRYTLLAALSVILIVILLI